MATFSRHQASLGNVGSYQVSGYPWISGSSITTANTAAAANRQHQYTFPKVAKSVTVIFTHGTAGTQDGGTTNVDTAGIRVHFNATGSGNVYTGNHYIELNAVDESVTFNTKCTEIYISRPDCSDETDGASTITYKIIAELTNIPTGELIQLTGSGLTE